MAEAAGFMTFDGTAHTLVRTSFTYSGGDASPLLGAQPAVALTVPVGYVGVRRNIGWGDRLVDIDPAMTGGTGTLVIREDEAYCMAPTAAAEAIASAFSGWIAYVAR